MSEAPPSRRVDQVVHTFRACDAVSDEARLFRDRLRERGFASSIHAVNAEPAVAGEVVPFGAGAFAQADALLYHHATVADTGLRLAAHTGRKALLYHGVTPAHFVEPYQPALAMLLAEGRAALRRIAPHFARRYADSRFDADELRTLAGVDADVLPFCLDARRFTAPAAERIRRTPGAGLRWLSVGRIAPNKGLLDLVAAFAASLPRDPEATLTLVGAGSPSDPYYWALQAALDRAGVRARVRLTGTVDDAALVRCYDESDVYVCLSEHEGFCVPLVEAMLFDVPIVAAAGAAVPETLGEAGVLLESRDPFVVAAAVATVCGDAQLTAQVLDAQRRRREIFLPERTLVAFDRAVDLLLAA